MNYKAFSLNGAWEMNYTYEKYIGTEIPNLSFGWIDPDNMRADDAIENAVPGYWEDMTESFRLTNFFRKLKINPEYGIQKYPMVATAPDMALPNIIGNFYYSKTIQLEEFESEDVSIYFGGVQNSVSVWINEVFIGRHEGYSTPFEMCVKNGILKQGNNKIFLSVSNHRLEGYNGEPVSGLTSRAANECTGGITGGVELRFYHNSLRDLSVIISKDLKIAYVKIEKNKDTDFEWFVYDGKNVLKSGKSNDDFSFDTSALGLWSPEHPKLYTLVIKADGGELTRHFGIRRLLAEGTKLKLNGKPYFLRGICEHCYFPDTIHPNHDYKYYRKIIKSVKKLGFNFIRFHTYIPEEEYMQAADELGILLHVECPNNTTHEEWTQIVKHCRRHSSVILYCSGNELYIDENFIEYLRVSADIVHENTDALYCPLNSLRGVDALFFDANPNELVELPLKHHPKRLKLLDEFSDVYSSGMQAVLSYISLDANPELIDNQNVIYNKPLLCHEICIDGTYADLSLKDRYTGTRVGNTELFSSVEQHLKEKGLIKNAPLYFRNSSQWQRRIRKYCFESVRRCKSVSGFDFLGPIDTHWHTFGYDVGMMNEFYELKPGETLENVLKYNSPSVIFNDLGRKTNYASGETLKTSIYISCYEDDDITDSHLTVRLFIDGKIEKRINTVLGRIRSGSNEKIFDFIYELPMCEKPAQMKLVAEIDSGSKLIKNEWELYLFPVCQKEKSENLIVTNDICIEEMISNLYEGKDILLLGSGPFVALPTSFRISLAGRTGGNLATVVGDHPILDELPNDGFCSWQFGELMEKGKAVCFESEDVPFNPIIEVVSTHKFVIRQSALFEFNVLNGRLLVCSFNFNDTDPAALWLKNKLIEYSSGDKFTPLHTIDDKALTSLANCKILNIEGNTNVGLNFNDITAFRKTGGKSERRKR